MDIIIWLSIVLVGLRKIKKDSKDSNFVRKAPQNNV